MEDVKELTNLNFTQSHQRTVSILVLMEDVKEPGNSLVIVSPFSEVSILVLMEDVKEHYKLAIALYSIFASFNPCFNGRCKRTKIF